MPLTERYKSFANIIKKRMFVWAGKGARGQEEERVDVTKVGSGLTSPGYVDSGMGAANVAFVVPVC